MIEPNDLITREMIEEVISPDEILFLISEMARMRAEGYEPSWFSQIAVLVRQYPRGSIRPLVIVERVQSGMRMLRDPRASGWVPTGAKPNCLFTHIAIFRAMALAPWYASGEQSLEFDPDEFFLTALERNRRCLRSLSLKAIVHASE